LIKRFRGRGLLLVYVGAVAAYGSLFWAFDYVPTQDGPAHLSSAVVFASLLGGDSPYAGFYELRLSPAPYWAYHAFMVPALALWKPLTAEKIFLSLYVVAFAVAGWRLTKAAVGKPSALGLSYLVFATSFPFQMGFFNSMLGTAAALLTAAFFWNYRERAGPRFWVSLNLLTAVCYAAHLLAWFAATFSILVLSFWLVLTTRKKVFAGAPLYLFPSYVLPLYFAARASKEGDYVFHSVSWSIRELATADFLVSFGAAQRFLAWGMAALFAFLLATAAAARLRPGRRSLQSADAFAALAALFIAVFFATPGQTPHGAFFISERMGLFPFLFAVPWLAAHVPRRLGSLAAGAAAFAVFANLLLLAKYYARENAELKTFTSGCCAVGPRAVLLPIVKDPQVRGRRVESLRHAVAYYVVERTGCNLVDMGANAPHFPIAYAPGVATPWYVGTFSNLRVYDLETARPAPDFVISYNINPFVPGVGPIFKYYTPVYFKGRLIVYERAAAPPPRRE
jgi:hypothetical protein